MTVEKNNIKYDGFKQESCFVKLNIPIVQYYYDDNSLKDYLVSKIDYIENYYKNSSKKFHGDGDTNTKSILTQNFSNFNMFDDDSEIILKFKKFVKKSFLHYMDSVLNYSEPNEYYFQCWGNKNGYLDYLDKHIHNNDFSPWALSGNFFIRSCGVETYTLYYNPLNEKITLNDFIAKENIENTLTIFPCFVPHSTTSNRSMDSYRYSLGIDIWRQQDLDQRTKASKCLVKL